MAAEQPGDLGKLFDDCLGDYDSIVDRGFGDPLDIVRNVINLKENFKKLHDRMSKATPEELKEISDIISHWHQETPTGKRIKNLISDPESVNVVIIEQIKKSKIDEETKRKLLATPPIQPETPILRDLFDIDFAEAAVYVYDEMIRKKKVYLNEDDPKVIKFREVITDKETAIDLFAQIRKDVTAPGSRAKVVVGKKTVVVENKETKEIDSKRVDVKALADFRNPDKEIPEKVKKVMLESVRKFYKFYQRFGLQAGSGDLFTKEKNLRKGSKQAPLFGKPELERPNQALFGLPDDEQRQREQEQEEEAGQERELEMMSEIDEELQLKEEQHLAREAASKPIPKKVASSVTHQKQSSQSQRRSSGFHDKKPVEEDLNLTLAKLRAASSIEEPEPMTPQRKASIPKQTITSNPAPEAAITKGKVNIKMLVENLINLKEKYVKVEKGWGNRHERKRLTEYIIAGMGKLNEELNARNVESPQQLIALIQDPKKTDIYKNFKEACGYLERIKKIPPKIADTLPQTTLLRQDGKRKLEPPK